MTKPYNRPHKDLDLAYILWLIPFTGIFGIHRFYLGDYLLGFLYLFTFSFLGIGYAVDMFVLPRRVRDINNGYESERSLAMAYVLLVFAGLGGAQHAYRGSLGWAFLYLITCGFMGIGWVIDLFLLPRHIRTVNQNFGHHSQPAFIHQAEPAH